MKFNGKRIKEDGKCQKHIAYKISKTRTLSFNETQQDGSIDKVELDIILEGNQEAIFSEEYKPANVDTCKKIDIMVFMYCLTDKGEVDENMESTLYLYDVKDTVGGKDVIFHLVEQWKAGIVNAMDFTRYINAGIKYNIGVITRNYDEERLDREIARYEQELNNLVSKERMPELILAKNYLHSRINIEKELEILKNFKKMVFYRGKEKFTFDSKKLEENNFYRFKMKY